MKYILPTEKSFKDYTEQFVVTKNDVPKIVRNSTNTSVKLVLDGVKTTLTNILDKRDHIGKNYIPSRIQLKCQEDQQHKLHNPQIKADNYHMSH